MLRRLQLPRILAAHAGPSTLRTFSASPVVGKLRSHPGENRQRQFQRGPVRAQTYRTEFTGGINTTNPANQDRDQNAWTTATRLKRWIDKHKGPLSVEDTEVVSKMVTEAPNYMVNAPVWNQLLGFMGRQKKLDRVWSLYNQMKKRNIVPTSRTYSAVLNAYSGISHSGQEPEFSFATPSDRTLSRVTIIYEQSQVYIKGLAARLKQASASSEDDLGVSLPGVALKEASKRKPLPNQAEIEEEVDLAPTNAYLKFLGRHGMWSEMQRVFLSLDTEGPLAADTTTYTIMFTTLYHVHRSLERAPNDQAQALKIGPAARGIWDQCIRQFGKIGRDPSRQIDNVLFAQYLRCLMRGRPEDHRQAISVAEQIWDLPSPGHAAPASASSTTLSKPSITPTVASLPKLSVDVRSATALISALHTARHPTLASHYSHLILANEKLEPDFDLEFLKIAILALSTTGDIQAVLGVLDMYQPPGAGKNGWSRDTWRAAITAARWAGDYSAALSIFQRATHLSNGVGHVRMDPSDKVPKVTSYIWSTPNGKGKDARGMTWIKPEKMDADAQFLGLLFKTALQKSNKEVASALDIFFHLGGEGAFLVWPYTEGSGEPLLLRTLSLRGVTASARKALVDRVELARDVERAAERIGEEANEGLVKDMGEIVSRWGPVLKGRLLQDASAVSTVRTKGNREREEAEWEDEDLEKEPVSRKSYGDRSSRDWKTKGDFERRLSGGRENSSRPWEDRGGGRGRRDGEERETVTRRPWDRDASERGPRKQEFSGRKFSHKDSEEREFRQRDSPERSFRERGSSSFSDRGGFGSRGANKTDGAYGRNSNFSRERPGRPSFRSEERGSNPARREREPERSSGFGLR
ncbi:hypothetical protein B9479_002904 [Cryptococcus floricola]|uniref:Pentatricopeptide repeat domain-containing protein n=1 Tax=Cryptococcus floricola TaxID=2591691 RepID=A0A5D3B2C5_9TREE|nr:hypothetical protein B9479_002904 [Cryptococcus floricola]